MGKDNIPWLVLIAIEIWGEELKLAAFDFIWYQSARFDSESI